MISLNVNGKDYLIEVPADTPLLWVIRDYLKMKGTKYGCGIGVCGTCTVHIDGKAERSCSIPVRDGKGKRLRPLRDSPKTTRLRLPGSRTGSPVRLLPAGCDHAGGEVSLRSPRNPMPKKSSPKWAICFVGAGPIPASSEESGQLRNS